MLPMLPTRYYIIKIYWLGQWPSNQASLENAAPLGDKLGKKITLIVAGILFCAGSIIQVASMGNTAVMFLGRVIGGLGVGSASMLVPPYIAEVSPPSIRGRLVGIYELGVQAGTCIGSWINYGVSINVAPTSTQWRIPFAIQLIPGGILIIGMFFLPESPRWLANFRNHELAITMLARLRNLPVDNEYVVHEMLAITKQIEQEKFVTKGSEFIADIREIALPGNRNRIALGIAIFIFMQMAGNNAINYYSPRIFKSIGLSGQNTGLISTGVYGIVRMAAVVIAMYWVVDRFGRTKMLIYGSAVSAFAMWFLGAFVKINPATADSTVSQPHISAGGYTAAVMIYIYAVGFCFSWAGIPWIYASKIFPLRIRSLCMAICTATHWLMNFVIARSTPYMIRNIKFGTYFVFAASLTLAIPFVYFFLPETKGLSLEDMDRLFGVARKDSRLSTSDHEKGNVQVESKDEKATSNGILYDKTEVVD